MARIKTGFSTFTDAGLLVEAAQIITSMTGNAYFPNPVPPLSEVEDAYDAYKEAIAATSGKEATMTKNKTRAVLERLLGELALYVQLNSKGDEVVLGSTAFRMVSKRVPVGVLPKPSNFTAVPGDMRGSIKLSLKSIDGANSYVYEYTTAPSTPTSNWETIITPRASTVVDDLTSGQKYTFRAVAVGANPTRIYSDEISSYVL
jgi:hypothetical protein